MILGYDLLAQRVNDHGPRIDRNEDAIAVLTLKVQRLGDEAASRDQTVVATAKALREAKEAQDATSRAETAKSEQTWSPLTRLFAVVTIIGVIVAIYAALMGKVGA